MPGMMGAYPMPGTMGTFPMPGAMGYFPMPGMIGAYPIPGITGTYTGTIPPPNIPITDINPALLKPKVRIRVEF